MASWEAQTATPWLVRYRLEIQGLNPTERTAEEEAIMAAQKAYEEWERELVVRGKALGLDDGKREMLLRQLHVKFGALPAWVEGKVGAASADDLNVWAERVVTHALLEDVIPR